MVISMKMKNHISMRFAGFLLSCLIPVFLWAGQTGKIAGKVTDVSTGEPLVGTNVHLEGMLIGASTDLDGDFFILNVHPGIYTITAVMVGYREIRTTNVRVFADRTTRLDFKMNPTIIEGEIIIVEAERPLIQKDLTATASSVSAQEIEAIPVESIQDVLQLQAGIIVDSNGEFHIRGGRANEIAYLVDGISISDPYSGKMAVNVNQETVQELKVISGTFNAEYGNAMSGVVEMVTKDPKEKFSFAATLYAGDYISKNTDLYFNIDDLKISDIYNLQVYFTGPVLFFKNKLRYYISFRRFYNDGWIYGERRYSPKDSSVFDFKSLHIEQSGDNQPVGMNSSSQYYGNFKLTYNILPNIKLNYNLLASFNKYRTYNHLFKYNPDGDVNNQEYGYTNMLDWNHMLSASTFYTLKLSYYNYEFESYLYKDLYDERYANPELLWKREDAYSFLTGGTNRSHFYRASAVSLGKFDITSQISKAHQVKAGFEYKTNIIMTDNNEARYRGQESGIFNPDLFFSGGRHEHRPLEMSAYIQDKIELENLIVNAGLRYDYFNSKGLVPLDPRDPGNTVHPSETAYKDAEPQRQLSPRIGLAFPISASGVIHASYGHFFQIPNFEFLYKNPNFAVVSGDRTLMGNADLKPQSTVIYEMGLQQELTKQIALDITCFYKDARNLLGTEIYETYVMGTRYARYENRDYGNIKGITLSINKRPAVSDYLIISLDYTYQVAEGNASDPNQSFYNSQSDPPKPNNIQVVPLDWDQRHTVNLSLSYSNPKLLCVGLIGQFQSGLPYTPAIQSKETTFENSGRKPFNYNIDLRLSKMVDIWKLKLNVFLKVYNLFDSKNELTVYSDTGRAGYSLVSHYAGDRAGHVNTMEEWISRPDYYSEPRKVLIGFTVSL